LAWLPFRSWLKEPSKRAAHYNTFPLPFLLRFGVLQLLPIIIIFILHH
jgi:hypothetical protein